MMWFAWKRVGRVEIRVMSYHILGMLLNIQGLILSGQAVVGRLWYSGP